MFVFIGVNVVTWKMSWLILRRGVEGSKEKAKPQVHLGRRHCSSSLWTLELCFVTLRHTHLSTIFLPSTHTLCSCTLKKSWCLSPLIVEAGSCIRSKSWKTSGAGSSFDLKMLKWIKLFSNAYLKPHLKFCMGNWRSRDTTSKKVFDKFPSDYSSFLISFSLFLTLL